MGGCSPGRLERYPEVAPGLVLETDPGLEMFQIPHPTDRVLTAVGDQTDGADRCNHLLMLQTVGGGGGGGGGGGFMDLQIIFWNFLKIFKKRIICLFAVDYLLQVYSKPYIEVSPGHYCPNQSKNIWIKCDDDQVNPTPAHKVAAAQAYILFYQRKINH